LIRSSFVAARTGTNSILKLPDTLSCDSIK
jgi:hypothetical protein